MESGLVFAACVLIPLGVGMANSFATRKSIRDWYPTIAKPDWTPPNWVFAPVWTVLYVMIGWAMWLVLASDDAVVPVTVAAVLWVLQVALNAAWSPAFFGRRDPPGALRILLGMDVAIIATIVAFAVVSPFAALLLVPYLLWGLFATVLNLRVVQMNDWPEASRFTG